MSGGSGRVVTGGGIASSKARVQNERLWVDASGSSITIAGGTITVPEEFTIHSLSASTSGQPIVVNGGTFVNVHTVPASSIDLVTIFVTNILTADETLILGWGGTGAGQQLFTFAPARETVVAAAEIVLEAGQTIQANLVGLGTCLLVGKVVRRAA